MEFLNVFRRLLVGGYTPSTESIQRQIINFLDGHGETEAATLYERIDIPVGIGHRTQLIDQAAQILVNQGSAQASYRSAAVDPVRADGRYTIKIRSEGA